MFVADTIPRELARIVEFLNEQMKADVRAVELSWFEGAGGVTALAPRVIGETERAQSEKAGRTALPPIGREAWIAEHLSPFGSSTVAAAEIFVAMVEEAGGSAVVASSQGSIITVFEVAGETLYPLSLSRWGKGSVQLCLGYLVNRSAFAREEVRRRLYDRLTAIVGPLTTKTLNGFPSFAASKLNDLGIRAGVAALLAEIVAAARDHVADATRE